MTVVARRRSRSAAVPAASGRCQRDAGVTEADAGL